MHEEMICAGIVAISVIGLDNAQSRSTKSTEQVDYAGRCLHTTYDTTANNYKAGAYAALKFNRKKTYTFYSQCVKR